MIQTEKREIDHLCTNIWLLIDADNSIWTKAYAIPTPMYFDMVQPLMVMPDGVKLLSCYRHTFTLLPVLRVYDPSDGTYTDVAAEIPNNTFGTVCLGNLHLDCFRSGKI